MEKEATGMKVAGKSYSRRDGFLIALEWMRYLTDIVSFNQKARIVIDYDPDKETFYTEIMLAQDAPLPADIR